MRHVIRIAAASFAVLASAWIAVPAQDAAKEPSAKKEVIGPLDDGSVTIGPKYAPAPELKMRAEVPKGVVKTFTLSTKESKIYPPKPQQKKGGKDSRDVLVYIPSQYVPGTPAPFSVIQDASYKAVLPTILDNMIHDKRLPVMLAIFVNNGGGSRSMEYDTVSGRYAEFIESEVLPIVEKECNVTLTKDPEGRAAMGGSSGGALRFYDGLVSSGVVSPGAELLGKLYQIAVELRARRGAWDYHENLIAKAEKKSIRVWLHVAENDIGAKTEASSLRNWIIANDRMAEVLKNKGYHYRYTLSLNSGHVDAKVTNQTLPEALTWLWQDYVAEKK